MRQPFVEPKRYCSKERNCMTKHRRTFSTNRLVLALRPSSLPRIFLESADDNLAPPLLCINCWQRPTAEWFLFVTIPQNLHTHLAVVGSGDRYQDAFLSPASRQSCSIYRAQHRGSLERIVCNSSSSQALISLLSIKTPHPEQFDDSHSDDIFATELLCPQIYLSICPSL